MTSRLSAEICRLRAPEKLQDRLLLSGVIGSSTGSLTDNFVIAYLFEIHKPWLPASVVLPSMAAVLEEQHATLSTKANLDDQFENILKAVNQKLNEVSEAGETDWIGNLNGFILLLGKEELHFSQTGHCPAYLLQNNRIRQITDDQTEKDPHPLKTFSNLASGHLQAGDYVLVANQELYNEISLDAMRRILNNSTPYTACLAIARELKKEKNPRVSTLIARIQAFDEKAPAPEAPAFIDMEEELQSNAKKFYRRMTPFLQAAKKGSQDLGHMSVNLAHHIGTGSLKVAQQAQQVTKEKVVPGAATLITKGSEKLKQKHRPVVELIEPHDPNKPALSDDQQVGEIISADAFSMEKPLQPEQQDFKTKTLYFITQILPFYLRRGFNAMSRWIEVPRNKKIAALGVGIILIVAVVWGALAGRNHSNNLAGNDANSTLIASIKNDETKIAADIAAGDTTDASTLITTAFTKLGNLANPSNSEKTEASSLWQTIAGQSDSLTKTTRLNSVATTYTFNGAPQSFFASLPYFYGFEPQGSALLRTGSGTLNVQSSTPLPDGNDTVVSAIPSTTNAATGFMLTKQSRIYEITQTGSTTGLTELTPESGTFATGTSLATYAGNLYILDSTSGLLWRYANNGGYAKGVMIINVNQVNIKNALSLAIDGSIYILQADGSILKLTSGSPDPSFSLQGVPELSQNLIRPLQIIASPNYDNIYVLDGGDTSSNYSNAKVLIFNKQGQFQGQYAFPASFTDVQAFDINPPANKLWILNGSTVNEFNL